MLFQHEADNSRNHLHCGLSPHLSLLSSKNAHLEKSPEVWCLLKRNINIFNKPKVIYKKEMSNVLRNEIEHTDMSFHTNRKFIPLYRCYKEAIKNCVLQNESCYTQNCYFIWLNFFIILFSTFSFSKLYLYSHTTFNFYTYFFNGKNYFFTWNLNPGQSAFKKPKFSSALIIKM